MRQFNDYTVLITGASSGIGRAVSLEFTRRGARTILVARRAELLKSLAETIRDDGGRATAIPCDVADIDSVRHMSRCVLEEGCPDILVNNAGYAQFGTVLDTDIAEIDSQMNTNYMGMVRTTKEFLPHMVDRASGHIINVASVAASFGLPGAAPYCASKYAMLGFSEGLYHELASSGVGVTVVSPITVKTDFFGGRTSIPYAISAEQVARAVVRAACSRRMEITVPVVARLAISLKHVIPYLPSMMVGRIFRRYLR